MSKSYAIQARELNDAVFEPTPIAAGKKDPFPHIPQGLKDTPRWLIWAEKVEGDKTKKIPVNGGGEYVAGKDSKNWMTYAEAISKSDNIGFQFSDEDKYCGVDLDGCVDPDTEEVEEWAEDIIGAFRSYAELSPSRTGFHIICETDIDHKGVNSGKVELYSKDRFFTMTGDKYDYDEITDCTKEYKTLLLEHKKSDSTDVRFDHIKLDSSELTQKDTDLCNKINKSNQGELFRMLYTGDIRAYDSQSEADMALCNSLAFWTAKDSKQMCRIFSASKLGERDKWKREDYQKRTIARAIEDCKETYTPPGEKEAVKTKFKFIMASDIIAAAQPTEWLIKGILMKDALSELFGPSGSYKSFLALAWALSVATGTKWFGHNVIQAPVLMVIGEGHNGYAKRIAAWCKDAGIDVKKLPLGVSEMPAQMLNDNSAYAVAEGIEQFSKQHGEVGLVCFDTVARNFGAGNENSTEDMTRFIYNLDRFIGKGRNRLLVHHTGHNNTERARGSSVLKAAVDVEYRMVKGESQITLSNTKMKDDPAFSDMYFKPERIIVGGNFGNLESSIILTSTKKVKTVLESAIFFLKQNDNAPKEKLESYLKECDHSGDAIRKMLDRERRNHGSKKRIYTRENRYSLYSF